LVSNRGYFRLDMVFNGTPRPLIAWTELPSPFGGAFRLGTIARGSHFTILVNDHWVGEAVDDSFRQGHFAFAAQAFEAPMTAAMKACRLDSRPLEVEAAYYRWNYYIVPDNAVRRALAETFFATGENLAAAVQLRKMERRAPLSADDLFLKAEVSIRLGLHDEAEAALDACLAIDLTHRRAAEEKANILYLRGRSLELRALADRLLEDDPHNARLLGLAGHARFALGDYPGAAASYRRAADLDREQPLFRMNEARAHDQAGARKEAAQAYLAAARLLALQGGDDDLALALRRLEALRPRSVATKEIRAKALYRQGKKTEAARLLGELVATGSEDSAVHYLAGMIAAERGEGGKALERYADAVRLEPDYPPYAFRYAERLYLESSTGADRGQAPSPATACAIARAIARALELAPEEGWTLNLAGQEALDRGELAEARRRLEAARAALPGEAPIAVNLAELESRENRHEAALDILKSFPADPACRNQAGNTFARSGRIDQAILEYGRACRAAPGDAEYRCNLAAAYLEAERYSDAEDSIRRALDLGGGPRALLLAGNLAMAYGDRPRAESAFRLGLEASPQDPRLLFALGRCYLSGRDARKASDCARKLATVDPERASRLGSEIEEATTERLSCSSCGRLWRVPRDLSAQSAASIRGMPPDESPAGACPRCAEIFCIACRKGELDGNR
ncbi:MAG: tetratricopeptide repeat protein, partial [Spirochaetaceae bacterium]|nr:tetratricopeptide repeat protein [Spirochaetaceae bacterium]